MKKIAILLAVLTVGALSAMAQGKFAFANNSAFPITSKDTGLPVGAGNAVLGPSSIHVALLIANDGAPLSSLKMVAMVNNSASTSALAKGTFNGGNPFVLPATSGVTTDGSAKIEYMFVAWDVASGVTDPVVALADWTAGQGVTWYGKSALGTGYTPATALGIAGATFGTGPGQVGGFSVAQAPEPSTLALGGIGAAALLLFRRRK